MTWILGAVHRKLDTLLNRTSAILLKISQPQPPAPDLTPILVKMDQMEKTLSERLTAIEVLLTPPPDDGFPDAPEPITSWRMVSERKGENDMWLVTFEADLPEIADTPANKDVELHRIKVVVDGAETQTIDLPKLSNVVTFEVEKGKTVMLKGSYVDDDGNEGPSVESQSFVAADTVPPDAPGSFGEIRNLGEREVLPEPPPPEALKRK